MFPSETARSKRAGLRIPVDFQVRCEYGGNGRPTVMAKAVNMSTGGLFITTSEPIELKAMLVLEFLMPDTLNSIQVQGESVWSCPCASQAKQLQGTGIKFVNLKESSLSLIRDYALSKLYDDEFVDGEGIVQLLSDIRNLPPQWRLKAYNILIKKGGEHLPSPQSPDS
ncbi:MAG: PilZ domain-containing protein [Proteobacteria bacterium]|nr:PilZ domain-containing protein [Pseudomonadota bacterium]